MSEVCKWAGYRGNQVGAQEGVRWILEGSTIHCEISIHDASDGWMVRRMQRPGDCPSERLCHGRAVTERISGLVGHRTSVAAVVGRSTSTADAAILPSR